MHILKKEREIEREREYKIQIKYLLRAFQVYVLFIFIREAIALGKDTRKSVNGQ